MRRKDVEEMTGLSRSTIYRQVSAGKFPAPVKTAARAVTWKREDIEKWIDEL